MEAETNTKHYLISGRVQGVGFRRFTERVALELNLSGWVRNLDDGRVEALAQGPAAALTTFEARLKTGPAHGHVENVVIRCLHKPVMNISGFTLRKDGAEPWSEN
jgi:acylphosphatase